MMDPEELGETVGKVLLAIVALSAIIFFTSLFLWLTYHMWF